MNCHTAQSGLSLMGNKNESIFLWMLEQERQKNRSQVLEETTCDPVAISPIGTNDTPKSEKACKDENDPSSPQETTDLEQLMKEKTILEAESHQLDEEQEKLNLRIKTLCDKIIQQMKKGNNEKRKSVSQMQATISTLEAQLGALSGVRQQEK